MRMTQEQPEVTEGLGIIPVLRNQDLGVFLSPLLQLRNTHLDVP